jgi:hypothetical protein
VTLDFTLFSTTASSSDTRSTRVWLEDTHVALRRTRSAQANNERITFVSALDQRNRQGYDILLFRPPVGSGKKNKAVTLFGGLWHELEHNTTSGRPYLGVSRTDIHDFDGESLPSEHEATVESSDEEPVLPRPKSPDSSTDDEPTQRNPLPVNPNISAYLTIIQKNSETNRILRIFVIKFK